MSFRRVIGAVAVCLLVVFPAQAEYTSIQANMLNGIADTVYSGGVMTIDTNDSTSQLTLNDPGPLADLVEGNVDLDLTTTFHHVYWDGPDLKAVFSGGNFSLNFTYDSNPYYIQGPISNMIFWVSGTGANSYIDGEGLFDAVFDLPGSNDWPAPLESSIKSLTITVGTDLSEFDWSTPLMDHNETVLTLYPDNSAIPGPATLLLLLPGVAVLRRR
ncbi:MAG: hypothetical protein JSU68_00895 [Phycisphaerales bacterium]|nr:MAG: hypothetical protein JSU68_00895 [Phycisphaerales bacterium]